VPQSQSQSQFVRSNGRGLARALCSCWHPTPMDRPSPIWPGDKLSTDQSCQYSVRIFTEPSDQGLCRRKSDRTGSRKLVPVHRYVHCETNPPRPSGRFGCPEVAGSYFWAAS
jgi:hypothetical protein